MKAKKFLSECKRMCDSFGSSCEGCPIFDLDILCKTIIMDNKSIDKTINIVEKWSKKHQKSKGDHK